MEEEFKVLGQRLKIMRTKKGIKQTNMAKALGLSQSNMSNVESGRTALTIQNLFKIRELLGVK